MSIAIGGICSDRDALGFSKGRNPALSSPVERTGTRHLRDNGRKALDALYRRSFAAA